MKLTVRYENGEKTKEFGEKILLWEALSQMGFAVSRPCGGKGTCGNCKVFANGENVLSCSTYLERDTVVDALSVMGEMQVETGGIEAGNGEGLVKEGYGLVVDIGTTTLAGYLYKFPAGKLVREFGMVNPQVRYGADVVTRMEYALQGGAEDLQNCLREQIGKMAPGVPIDKYVICGNTVMLHFLTGRSVKGLSCAPYTPESLFGHWQGNIYLPGCISAFVGADAVCAVLYSEMWKHKVSILVDMGTNAEMVLCKDGQYICCSAAAGPALEGGEISMGMPAAPGAIDRVFVERGAVKYTTIGGAVPRGICGSGLIDGVAVLRRSGILDETGYLEEAYEIPGSGVFISPEDIRQVQLAKAAIRAGLETLLYECGVGYEDVEQLYIAGGFGSYLDKENGGGIGLLPRELIKKTRVLGNGAGKGACLLLQSGEAVGKTRDIVANATTLSLADSGYFSEKYVEQMMFE